MTTDFSFALGPVPSIGARTVTFTDLSSPPASSWSWAFGDGVTSTAQNPTHTFTVLGNQDVRLTTNLGNVTKRCNVPPVVTVAGFTSNVTGASVAFTDTTAPPPLDWLWEFGDGGSSTDQNPVHSYAVGGSYAVQMTVDPNQTIVLWGWSELNIYIPAITPKYATASDACDAVVVLLNAQPGISGSYVRDDPGNAINVGIHVVPGGSEATVNFTHANGPAPPITVGATVSVSVPAAEQAPAEKASQRLTYTLPVEDVVLVIKGRAWGGWLDVRITRGIERLPSDFEVRLTEFLPGEEPIEILRGDPCVLKIGADVVLTGYVDRIVRTMDSRQHTVAIAGRSKCADLVDCAAEWPGGQIVGSSVLEIAKTLAQPYGIGVTCIGDAGPPIPQFNLMRGETPFQIIERLCRFGQLLAYDTPSGDLLLTAVSKTPTASGFKEGVNVIRAQMSATLDQRFSEYYSYLQSMDTLGDAGDGGDLQAVITDTAVPRHRRRIMICETSGAIGWEIAQKRAGWEAQRRRGRSTEVRVTTDSWRDSAGTLYTPNTLAYVELPALRLRSASGDISGVSLTIGEVTYRRSDAGTTCELQLMPSEAFTPQPFNVLQLLPFAELAALSVPKKP